MSAKSVPTLSCVRVLHLPSCVRVLHVQQGLQQDLQQGLQKGFVHVPPCVGGGCMEGGGHLGISHGHRGISHFVLVVCAMHCKHTMHVTRHHAPSPPLPMVATVLGDHACALLVSACGVCECLTVAGKNMFGSHHPREHTNLLPHDTPHCHPADARHHG